jgi:3,4-dihydroxy 2-butanone 4-phosphate synthase/GTP cyclohydrolase II
VKGDISGDKDACVRVHMEDTFKDVLQEATNSFSVDDALKHISKADNGVFLLLRKQSDSSILKNIDRSTPDANGDDIKTYGVGAQILSDLGVKKMKILGSPRKLHGLKGFGLEVSEYVEINK